MSRLKHYYGLNHPHYMRNNAAKRGLVKDPGDWPRSSWGSYFWNDASVLATDLMP